MNPLPSLVHNTEVRPHRLSREEMQLMPHAGKRSFWKKVYDTLYQYKFRSPVVRNIAQYINPLFGFFGKRVHPSTHEIAYFHAGVELEFESPRKIYPIADGILEYSGYGAINGYYVLLSHPEIQTEDGYILHSMYCHLKKPLLQFSSYQKMLREISLGTYPSIEVSKKEVLGMAGSSGVTRNAQARLYLQIDFRKYGKETILLDPLLVLNNERGKNTTAHITTKEALDDFLLKQKKKT